MSLRDTSYCVICRLRDGATVRVVGPFEDRDAALHWAGVMRQANSAWTYMADVMEPPTKVAV